MSAPIYLASASPRRAELLRQIAVSFTVLAVDIDESVNANEAPDTYVLRLARAKALAAWQHPSREQNIPVLAADTTVVGKSGILGKPSNAREARAQIEQLAGCTHHVYTAVCLRKENAEQFRCHRSKVSFRAMSADEIEEYVSVAEGADKAGGYAIQGYAARFITQLNGSYSSVMGLPLHVVDELLRMREFRA